MKFQEWRKGSWFGQSLNDSELELVWTGAKQDSKKAATMTDQEIRLMAGELTGDEMLAVQAVLAYVRRKIDE